MTLKTAVLAPMPSASTATATQVKPGVLRSIRIAKRRSCRRVDIIGLFSVRTEGESEGPHAKPQSRKVPEERRGVEGVEGERKGLKGSRASRASAFPSGA